MEIKDYKELIGKKCLVIDTRSKKKQFEDAVIISISINLNTYNNSSEIYEHISYKVKLCKYTKVKNKYGEKIEYQRQIYVNGNSIKI